MGTASEAEIRAHFARFDPDRKGIISSIILQVMKRCLASRDVRGVRN
jgi:hypothetical protein